MSERIDFAELRRIIRDVHDFMRHPERETDTAQAVALMSLPHPLLLAEQLVRERMLRVKAERSRR